MDNHVHLQVYAEDRDSLALELGNAHGKYAQWFNARHDLSGHVWANRYYSTPLDDAHMWAAVRYIELNPVRAGMVQAAEQYPWSSTLQNSGLVCARNSGFGGLLWDSSPFPGRVTQERWCSWLAEGLDQVTLERLRSNTMTGRPCGGEDFIDRLEQQLNRILRPQKVGRKPKGTEESELVPDFFGGSDF